MDQAGHKAGTHINCSYVLNGTESKVWGVTRRNTAPCQGHFTRRPNPFSGVDLARCYAVPLAVQTKRFVKCIRVIMVEPVITVIEDWLGVQT